MRFGVVYELGVCPYYRAIDPMTEMERRGHEVVWPDEHGRFDVQRLATCDVVHVYRNAADDTRRAVASLVSAGAAITYDNDDNMAALPKDAPNYETAGGLKGQRTYGMTVKLARMARIFTTTSEVIAEKYRRSGVKRVEVIPNTLSPDLSRPRTRHDGLVIGWVAGIEHEPDARRLKIPEALQRLLTEHDHVRVECIGVDLALADRYRHDPWLAFEELPRRIGGFDIGIAPLVDNPLNRARSDIKLKEYAASGVPWLASPVGPYAGLGDDQGGLLVPDHGWFDALERLVTNRRHRRRLARQAVKWAKGQTIGSVADRWEEVFVSAATPAAPLTTWTGRRPGEAGTC